MARPPSGWATADMPLLSPDGRWVISVVGAPAKLVLLPTGVGEPKQLTDDKTDHFNAGWLPDSKSIFFATAEAGHRPRSYLLDVQSGSSRAITPEGTICGAVSPDGLNLLCMDSARQRWLYPVAGGEPQKFNVTTNPNENIMGFFPDGKSVRLRTRTIPMLITKVDIASGHRELWKEIAPADAAGVQSIPSIKFSADGKSYAYSIGRILSDLFVVDGIK